MRDEKAVMHDVTYMLRHHYGLWPDHCEDGHRQCKPGRPDLIVMNPRGAGYYIEVKDLDIREGAFSFSEITVEQRKWLTDWEQVRPGGSFLALGITHNYRVVPDAIYFIPWFEWLPIEATICTYQNSLPYFAGPHYRVEMQEKQYDIRLLSRWKCPRVAAKRPDGGWRLPPDTIKELQSD